MPDYDERGPRLLTREHDGQPGEPFELWAKGFLDAATGKGDQDASWAATALGTDPQVGLTAAQVSRRTVRRRELYSAIVLCQSDESIKDVLRTEANGNGRTAWIVLTRELGIPTSGLTVIDKIQAWHNLSILKDIGISEQTIERADRMLTGKNAELPMA